MSLWGTGIQNAKQDPPTCWKWPSGEDRNSSQLWPLSSFSLLCPFSAEIQIANAFQQGRHQGGAVISNKPFMVHVEPNSAVSLRWKAMVKAEGDFLSPATLFLLLPSMHSMAFPTRDGLVC